jgi:hypothetical protein
MGFEQDADLSPSEVQPDTLDVSPSNPRRINRLKVSAPPRYLENPVSSDCYSSEVIENMERERGLEPPAYSLGKWTMFCFQ